MFSLYSLGQAITYFSNLKERIGESVEFEADTLEHAIFRTHLLTAYEGLLELKTYGRNGLKHLKLNDFDIPTEVLNLDSQTTVRRLDKIVRISISTASTFTVDKLEIIEVGYLLQVYQQIRPYMDMEEALKKAEIVEKAQELGIKELHDNQRRLRSMPSVTDMDII